MKYRQPSPAPSLASQSDDLDEELIFIHGTPILSSPAQWTSHRSHRSPPPLTSQRHSPVSLIPPELLIFVFRYLYSPRDIYNVMRVSRTWCQCSVELLWHKPNILGVATLIKMIKVLNDPRPTFHYASLIRRLNFLALGPDLTDSMFSRLSHCDRLERLTLVNCSSLSADVLATIFPRCPNLVAVDLTAVVETDDRAVISLANTARRLQGINLTGCKNVTDIGVFALAERCNMLRRVKLSGVELLTDAPICTLAKNCPLLLEMDLNKCKLITDISIRDIWTYSVHMRELRLSSIPELTDAAFPAPLKPNNQPHSTALFNSTRNADQLPPLIINRHFEHLRMLDLTACSLITDDAVEGIISHAPKIRNLVLSKCVLLTDASLATISRLGRHLHYLHLGHAAKITDPAVRGLARSCTRLRYVDFANCINLSDMSVFELASLPKLRRIGLVRVDNLTDESVYALADRHATLERIHLSYCDQISVMAVYFLLQKLHKLTHLSLTGVPAFRQEELQQFCRPPPPDFNVSQRAAFCVFSGKGVSDLRTYLTELFDQITELNGTDDTEYEDDEEEEYENDNEEDASEPMETEDYEVVEEGEDEDEQLPVLQYQLPPTVNLQRGMRQAPNLFPVQQALPNPNRWTAQLVASASSSTGPSRRSRGFAQSPVQEASPSQSPPRSPHYSDIASNRSSASNGAGFFRNYQEGNLPSSSRSNGVLTPDLDFAELGHGRGAAPSIAQNLHHINQPGHPIAGHGGLAGPSAMGVLRPMTFADNRTLSDPRHNGYRSYHESMRRPQHTQLQQGQAMLVLPIPVDSMSVDGDDDVIVADLRGPNGSDGDGRGRTPKRNQRGPMTPAEQYANSIMYGRNGQGSGSNGGGASRPMT